VADDTDGTLAEVEANCSAPVSVEAEDPVQAAGTTLSTDFSESKVGLFGNSSRNPSISIPGGIPTFLEVEMFVDSSAPVEEGTYDFTVTLTATPD
jgi:hypothetical protein